MSIMVRRGVSYFSSLSWKLANQAQRSRPAAFTCIGAHPFSLRKSDADETDFGFGSAVSVSDPEQYNVPVQRAQHILDAFNPSGTVDRKNDYLILENATIKDAIDHLVRRSIGASMVTNMKEEIVGIFTARDILRFISHNGIHGSAVEGYSSMGDPMHNFNAKIGKNGRMSDGIQQYMFKHSICS
jgi:hypothetical protein